MTASSTSEKPTDGLAQIGGAEVGGHDQHGVLEVDRAALGVGEAAVLEDLQQRVEDVGVRLFDLVEEHDGEGLAPHRLGELATLFVADVSRRRADEAADTVCFSMYSLMSSWISELSSPKSNSASALASSVLPTPVGPRKMNEPDGRLGSLSPARVRRIARRERVDRVLLADDPLVELVFHAKELRGLLLGELVDRDAGPVREHLGDDVLVDDVEELDALGTPLLLERRLALELRLLLVGELLRLLEVLPLEGRVLLVADRRTGPLRSCLYSGGVDIRRIRSRLPASSMRSIALSGRKRSEM